MGKSGFYEGRSDEPELGFIIAREAQRKGYCMEACGAILEYGFRELDLSGCRRWRRRGIALLWLYAGNWAGRGVEASYGGQKLCNGSYGAGSRERLLNGSMAIDVYDVEKP